MMRTPHGRQSRSATRTSRASWRPGDPDPAGKTTSPATPRRPDWIRVVVMSPRGLARAGLTRLLDGQPDFTVCGETDNPSEAVAAASTAQAQVLLLDLALPADGVTRVLRSLRQRELKTRALVVAAASERPLIVAALRAGALGVVLKDGSERMLFSAIRAVARGSSWVGRRSISDLLRSFGDMTTHAELEGVARVRASLTPREVEVLTALADGASNREIARRLEVREQTVKNLLSHIFDKVGVSSRLELAVYALHHGLARTE